MSYTKQGVNYGIGALPVAKIEADLDFLRIHFDNIRISYPAFNNAAAIAYWQDICLRAKSKGFNVMWGIYCPGIAGTDWFKFLQTFVDLSAWAATNGINFGFNEDMFHNNDAVIPDDYAVKDLHLAASIAKMKNPTSILHISLAGAGELDKFIAYGSKGAFDFVGVNQYGTAYESQVNINKLVTAYGANTLVTEFNTGRGFDPLYGDEALWKANVKSRADHMQASDIAAFYIYTYAFNPEGNGKWNFRTGQNPETQHEAFDLFRRQ